MNTYKLLIITVCVGFFITLTKTVYAEETWTEVGGYIFLTDVSGDLEFGQVETDFDASFSDLVKNLDIGAMVLLEHKRGDWTFLLDLAYISLSVDDTTASLPPLSVELDSEVTQTILEGFIGRRIYETSFSTDNKEPKLWVDLFAGIRYTKLEADLSAEASALGLTVSADRNEDFDLVDPVLGIRVQHKLNDKWRYTAYADYGGFGVDSEKTVQFFGVVNRTFSNGYRAYAGVRYINWQYEDNSGLRDFEIDVDYKGPMFGVSYRF